MKHFIKILIVFSIFLSCEDVDIVEQSTEIPSNIKDISIVKKTVANNQITTSAVVTSLDINADNNTITAEIRPDVETDSLFVTVELEPGCSISPLAGAPKLGKVGDFSGELKYKVSSQNSSSKIWNLQIKKGAIPPIATIPSSPTAATLIKKGDANGIKLEVEHSAAKIIETIDSRIGYNYSAEEFATIKATSLLDFVYTSNFTILMWVKTTATNSDPVLIGNQNWASSNNTGLTIAYKAGIVKFVVKGGSKKISFQGGHINDGKWHMVVLSVDRDGKTTGYIDTQIVDSKDTDGLESFKNSNPFRIAQDGEADYGDQFVGSITDVRFYNYAMGLAEVIGESRRY